MRAIASFLAYINVATPPDIKSPSIADAFMGLKLGKAFRDLGAKTGREAIRALPMAAADLVQEVFEEEAVRGPLATRGVALHLDGAVGDRHRGGVPERFRRQRRRRGGHRGVRARRHGRARGRARSGRRGAFGVDIRTGTRVVAIRSKDGRVLGVTLVGRHRDRLVAWSCRAPTPSAPCVSATRWS